MCECGSAGRVLYCHACEQWSCSEDCWNDHNRREHGAQGEDEDDWYPGGWFGASWDAPVCREDTHLETPVGWLCVECVFPIEPDDQGMLIPYTYGGLDETSGRYEPCGTTLTADHLACFRRRLGVDPALATVLASADEDVAAAIRDARLT